ncbi:MAG: transposase [Anaerolineales bacterium]|nr:transposase [Anaerolineales bacterium]
MSGKKTIQPKDWREGRRLRAWKLKQKGWKQRDIAEALGVSDGAVSQWLKKARRNGYESLRNQPGGGPKQRLSDEKIAQLPALLAKEPRCYGFDGERWTHSQVARLIEQQFDVSYTPSHVGRILKRLGWNWRETLTKDRQGNGRGPG